MKSIKIGKYRCMVFDNGGTDTERGTIDRFTIIPIGKEWIIEGHPRGRMRWYLGCSETGLGYSNWGEIPMLRSYQHLGQKVDWISGALRAHVKSRLEE